MAQDIRMVPLDRVRPNPVALRNVNKESEGYQGLVQSIRERGFMGSISGREREDPETGENYIEILDGLHRYSAATDVGLSEIAIEIRNDLDDQDALETQMLMNLHKIETRPSEYTQQLMRILNMNPMMTEKELAKKLGKSYNWIQDRLRLTKIENPEIQTAINEGAIPLSKAYHIAKLPTDEQPNWVERAMTDDDGKFRADITARVKELADARRKGRAAPSETFIPTMHLQKVPKIKAELENLSELKHLFEETKVKTVEEAAIMTLKWIFHVDPINTALAEAEWKKRQEEKKQKKIERAKERASKAQEELNSIEAAEVS